MSDTPVLIVGAGPTGLNLALRLARHGVPFRIIDQHDRPAQESRALAVHARTLEFYRQLGLADAIVAKGVRVELIQLHEGGKEQARIPLKDIGEGLSPYPFILDFPQDEHEQFLVDRLREAGVEVERGASLLHFTQNDGGVDALLSRDGHEERVRVLYLCGCDGARSKVREGIGANFGGGTYEHVYYVADVRLETPDEGHAFHLALDADSFALRLPARRGAMERVIGIAPEGVEEPTFDVVRGRVEHLLGIKVAELNWFSTYKVHHRVADRFRAGRAFLLGDAGHLHSPIGGQGMNTGIGDAVNLSWKLASVVRGHAAPALLDTYEPERIRFARELVATTDRLFNVVVGEGLTGKFVRSWVVPTVLPAATRLEVGRRTLFKLVSQIHIRYPDSTLSRGKAGHTAGGDRLPWVADLDNFAPLQSAAWQLHTYGEPMAELTNAAERMGLSQHRFAWSEQAGEAGLERDAAYLVRPDGYVGLAMARPKPSELEGYVSQHGLRFGTTSGSQPHAGASP